MKISELSDTSKDFLCDFKIAAMVGTSLADGEIEDEEVVMVNYVIDHDRDYLDSSHPAFVISSNLRKRVMSNDEYFAQLPPAHSMVERLNPILESLDEEDANDFAWWVMLGCNLVATFDGKRVMTESVYIIDLFRNLGWDYSEAMDNMPDEPVDNPED